MMSDYETFLASKRITTGNAGFDVDPASLNPMLFDFQRDIVVWALRKGRAAVFAECGLGKGPIALEWGRRVSAHALQPVLILAPLAVAQQFRREAEKFHVPLTVCREQADVRAGINVTNYEMLPHFDAGAFSGVVLDESSLLKSYMGATKRLLIETFAETPFKLCCTATPAPNDHMELGNHSEFLGIMPSSEMLMRWFINDTMNMGTYRLKGHAVADFWDWVASWGVSLRRPSDLGYDDAGFDLPPLHMEQIVVPVDMTVHTGEMLFRLPTISATTLHQEMRLTAPDRAEAAAALVNGTDEAWLVWCNTNYEADALTTRIPDAVEVRGSEPTATKERKLLDFIEGRSRVLITKPSIAGFGLNMQRCHNVAFVGLSYSFEQFYQAIRRTYRFGQTEPVNAFVITASTEGAIVGALAEKMAAHERMMDGMNHSANRLGLDDPLRLKRWTAPVHITLPDWLEACA